MNITQGFIIALMGAILLFTMPVGFKNAYVNAEKCYDIKYEEDGKKMPGKNHDDNSPSEKEFKDLVFDESATLCEVAYCYDNHECKGELEEHERDEFEDSIAYMASSEEQQECLDDRYDLPDGGSEALQAYELFDCAVLNY